MARRRLELLRTSLQHFCQEIYRQSLVRNPVFCLVSLLIMAVLWLLPRASPRASTYAPPRESYAVPCVPIPSWASSVRSNTPSTNQLPEISFQVDCSVLVHKINYSRIYSSSSEIHSQGGKARSLFNLITNQQQAQLFSVPGSKRSNAFLRDLRHAHLLFFRLSP